jgi:hypothetical protein
MLFRQRFLDGIRDGRITLAFRRWRRPSVRAGGTLLTPVGELRIGSVAPVALESISEEDARRAGYDSRSSLLADLTDPVQGVVYRIELASLGADPRIALRTSVATGAEQPDLVRRLDRLDARAGGGPWTRRVLELLDSHPEVSAARLSALIGQEKEQFKINVRKLKALGLTESLERGYRLSPRGAALLEALRSGRTGTG